jgi:hypothetical protein
MTDAFAGVDFEAGATNYQLSPDGCPPGLPDKYVFKPKNTKLGKFWRVLQWKT